MQLIRSFNFNNCFFGFLLKAFILLFLIMKSIFLSCGLSLFCLGLAMAYRRFRFYKESESTIGKVIEYKRHETNYSAKHAVIEFTVANRKRTFQSSFATNDPKYKIGDEIPVRYIPSHPETAEIGKSWIIWFEMPICFIFAFVFLWLGMQ